MTPPPLCVIQARYNSTRLPGKMLLKLGDETLIARAWRIAGEAFGAWNCVMTVPLSDMDGPLGEEIERIGARVEWWPNDEADVLGRFHAAAHVHRWHPDSVIVRYTPDDPWKTVEGLRLVASGVRHVVEFGGEAFTLAQLDAAHEREVVPERREHITHALFEYDGPQPAVAYLFEKNLLCLSIDTAEDYHTACVSVGLGAA